MDAGSATTGHVVDTDRSQPHWRDGHDHPMLAAAPHRDRPQAVEAPPVATGRDDELGPARARPAGTPPRRGADGRVLAPPRARLRASGRPGRGSRRSASRPRPRRNQGRAEPGGHLAEPATARVLPTRGGPQRRARPAWSPPGERAHRVRVELDPEAGPVGQVQLPPRSAAGWRGARHASAGARTARSPRSPRAVRTPGAARPRCRPDRRWTCPCGRGSRRPPRRPRWTWFPSPSQVTTVTPVVTLPADCQEN